MSKPLILDLKEKVDKIIEKGSNDNGTYIKFSDGTLIQYGNANGVENNYKWVTYPIQFKNVGIVTANVSVIDSGYIYQVQPFDYTSQNFKAYVRFQSISGGAWGTGSNWFNWLAVGTWK